jgi:hypothetical protein
MAGIGYTNFVLQYWFLVLILSIGTIAALLFNIITYFFYNRKFISPTEENQEGDKANDVDNQENKNEMLKSDQEDVENFRKEALVCHNKYRQLHGTPPLAYNHQLSLYAQHWADHLLKFGKIVHSPVDWRKKFNGELLGESIVTADKLITGNAMSYMWYSESSEHDYNEDAGQEHTEAFTQMVWYNTRIVGFGRSFNKDGQCFAVALYYPAGNLSGQYSNNVYEPSREQ